MSKRSEHIIRPEAAQVSTAVAEVVERVFATVAAVRTAALRPAARDKLTTGAPVLGQDVQDLLLEPEQLAVGLGLVVAPRGELPLRLEWWQVDRDRGRLRTLEPDLRPTSLGYYDYTAAEWFGVPRRTGRRHVVGPYVDVHGTGQYLLTLTEPVVIDGEFAGVAGADVPVRRFETHLLRVLDGLPGPFVLVNDEERVVLSTAPQWLVGELVATDVLSSTPAAEVAGTPWRLLLVAGGSAVTA